MSQRIAVFLAVLCAFAYVACALAELASSRMAAL